VFAQNRLESAYPFAPPTVVIGLAVFVQAFLTRERFVQHKFAPPFPVLHYREVQAARLVPRMLRVTHGELQKLFR